MRDFKHTMDILVKSYLNDTLEHGSCIACAVGNIIAGNCNYTYKKITNGLSRFNIEENGKELDNRVVGNWVRVIMPNEYESQADLIALGNKELSSTGYTVLEITKIEKAFESMAYYSESNDECMFRGLLAVLDVLAEIHEVDFYGKKIYEDQLTEVFHS